MVEQAFNSQHQPLNTPKNLAHHITIILRPYTHLHRLYLLWTFMYHQWQRIPCHSPCQVAAKFRLGPLMLANPVVLLKNSSMLILQLCLREWAFPNLPEIRSIMKLGRQHSTHVLTNPGLHLNTNYCVCASVSRVNPSNLQKIWAILQRHMARLSWLERKYGGKRRAFTFRLEE